ncbi:fimbrial protein [Serratia fonticola]|uniref:fimbrial protein n=1 Tax=Serratia fonticola TaxID=47917 RepID=UPI000409A6AD|nr:fimbrial protein [Serratia fonticola]
MKMEKAMLKTYILVSLLMVPVTFSHYVSAAPGDVKFSGTLIEPPPCTFNDGSPILVDFGTAVMTHRVDGSNYAKPINYNLVCTTPPLNTMRIKVQGTASTFDTKVLRTAEKTDLGIAITADNKALPINTWLNFNNPASPKMQAVPVKKSGATLTGGSFTATATMQVDYQ